MRLGAAGSRSGARGDELLPVLGEFLEDGFEMAGGDAGKGQQPAAELPLDLVEGLGAVDLVGRVGVGTGVGGDIGRQRIEVVAERLGAEILLHHVPGKARRVFETDRLVEPVERAQNQFAFLEPGGRVVRQA